MKLKELIVKLQELEEQGHGENRVYYETQDQFGDIESIRIEKGLEWDWLDEIYLS